jgi:hypothetical protein
VSEPLPLADPGVDFSTMTPEEVGEFVMTHDMSAWMAAHPERGRFVTGKPEENELR